MSTIIKQDIIIYMRAQSGSMLRLNKLYEIITMGKVTPHEFNTMVGNVTQSDLRGLIYTGFIGKILKGDIDKRWLNVTELKGCKFTRRMGDTVYELVDVVSTDNYPDVYNDILIGSFADFLLMNPHIKRQHVIKIFGGVLDYIYLTYRDYHQLVKNGQDDCFYLIEFVKDKLKLQEYINVKRSERRDSLVYQIDFVNEEWYLGGGWLN